MHLQNAVWGPDSHSVYNNTVQNQLNTKIWLPNYSWTALCSYFNTYAESFLLCEGECLQSLSAASRKPDLLAAESINNNTK